MIAEETEKIATDGVLLWKDKYGAIRVAKTRVLLDMIINAYNRGDTPEQIQEGFPTLELADVYMVIGYYLRNKAEVDTYLAEGVKQAEENWRRIDALQGDYQERLRRRLKPHLYETEAKTE
jgi:uncharacterized protein (DUF433 family)